METTLFHYAPEQLVRLAVALLLGLMIGLQQGWVQRDRNPGERVAGIRTFTLISLFGAASAILATQFSLAIVAVALGALALVLIAAYIMSIQQNQNRSITNLIAALLTFCIGALCMQGDLSIIATLAVIVTIMLDIRDKLHAGLKLLKEHELDAAIKLLVMTVVMLPLLPNTGYGPWQALNPYEIWWMVVLIASISFVGYFAVKIGGTHRGIIFTSLFAGLSSSTALSLHYARLSRKNPTLSPMLAGGILAACATMFPRVLFVCFLLNQPLAHEMLMPIVVMTSITLIPALWIWFRSHRSAIGAPSMNQNPLELSAALIFGVMLTLIMLASHWLRESFGDEGIYVLAAVSAITDVDAINLSLSRMSANESASLTLSVAATAIILASSINSLVKAGLAAVIGEKALAIRVVGPLLLAVAVGLGMII